MPISTNSEEGNKFQCRGGPSFGCKHIVSYEPGKDSKALGPHEPVEPRRCKRCRVYLGCKLCAQIPSELICLRCHDWATNEAEQEHGAMVNRGLAASKLAALVISLDAQMAIARSRRGTVHELDWQDQERRQMLRDQAASLGVKPS